MAMDKDRLGTNIVEKLKTLNAGIDGASESFLLTYWKAISDEIIKEIKENMNVTTTVTVPNIQTGTQTAIGTGQETNIS